MKNIILLTILTIATSCFSIKNEDEGFLKGYFSYFADAAIFLDCQTNEKYPVAMEGDYISLEKKYLELSVTDGQKILVKVNGKFIEREKIEGEGKRKFLIVNKFIEILSNQTCN
jgi:copper homeostasis protein (lipoprotein)